MVDNVIDWTYTGRPDILDRDSVRFLVGDTNPDDKKVADREITFALAESPNIYYAAAMIAMGIAGRYATRVDKSVGDLSIRYGQLRLNYLSLAGELKMRGAIRGGGVYAGGITKTDRDAERQSTERIQPAFEVGMDDREGDGDDDRDNIVEENQ